MLKDCTMCVILWGAISNYYVKHNIPRRFDSGCCAEHNISWVSVGCANTGIILFARLLAVYAQVPLWTTLCFFRFWLWKLYDLLYFLKLSMCFLHSLPDVVLTQYFLSFCWLDKYWNRIICKTSCKSKTICFLDSDGWNYAMYKIFWSGFCFSYTNRISPGRCASGCCIKDNISWVSVGCANTEIILFARLLIYICKSMNENVMFSRFWLLKLYDLQYFLTRNLWFLY